MRAVGAVAWLLWLCLGGCDPAPDASPSAGSPTRPPQDDGGPRSVVQVSQSAMERAGLRLAEAARTPLAEPVEVPAEVQLEPDRVVHVAPLASGQLVEVVATVGQRVEAGAELASLRSVALGEARSALARAEANVEVARANFQRQAQLREEQIGSERAYLEARAELRRAQAELTAAERALQVYGQGGEGATVPIRSPIAGEVVQRHATVGEVVDPDHTLFVVADTRRVWVVGRVYPQDVAAISEGAPATLRIADLPGRRWQAPLSWVSPVLDPETRTLPVRVELDNEGGELRPGMFGTLSVAPSQAEAVLNVASSGVVEVDGEPAVFVPGAEPGEFRLRPIRVGRRRGDRVEVLEGLAPGDAYVSEGAFLLKSQLMRGASVEAARAEVRET